MTEGNRQISLGIEFLSFVALIEKALFWVVTYLISEDKWTQIRALEDNKSTELQTFRRWLVISLNYN